MNPPGDGMRRALRICMVSLVLASLLFVRTTEAARWAWLGPLFGLTIASPWLLRLTRFLSVRLLWNLSVLGTFALLVRHVTYAGAAFLLEDGLLLAALCQVHLVNNLSDAQKPDLLFFNSFLIAVVTSFLSVDVGYSLVLLVYAPLLVISMQLLALSRSGVAEAPGLVRGVARSGLLRSGAVLAVTLTLFLVVPRDFGRRGLLGETLGLKAPGSLETAFSDRIDLSQSGQVGQSSRIVMTVRSSDGTAPPNYWRGAALDHFDGLLWRAARGVREAAPWCGSRGLWTRTLPSAGRTMDVYLVDPDAPRLFAPLDARRLELQNAEVDAAPQPDGNFRRTLTGQRRPVRYTVEMAKPRTPGGRKSPDNIAVHVALDARAVPQEAYDLRHELRKDIAPGAPQYQVAERFRRAISARFEYVAPGAEGGARSLAEFLEGKAGGHCEYFATALAVTLRLEGIPCRVVTGYRSEEVNDALGTLTVRAQHAHAWVEVLDPEAGWTTLDATPAGGGQVQARGLLDAVRQAADRVWSAVAGFNKDAREDLFAWVSALPGRIARHPGDAALFSVALALVLLAARLRRRRREEPHGRAYRRALRKLKLDLAPTETPRELLTRARRTAYPAEGLRELEVATAAHEQARYVV
jgi:protein-glutamine gamma-glutamyltransferase